jgi:hypothetical protein
LKRSDLPVCNRKRLTNTTAPKNTSADPRVLTSLENATGRLLLTIPSTFRYRCSVAASASTRGIDEGSSISASDKAEVTNRNTGRMEQPALPRPTQSCDCDGGTRRAGADGYGPGPRVNGMFMPLADMEPDSVNHQRWRPSRKASLFRDELKLCVIFRFSRLLPFASVTA